MAIKFIIVLGLVASIHGSVIPGAPVAFAPGVPVVKSVSDHDPYPQYSYAYDVQDSITGDSKSQHETRNGDVVTGSYSLIEADGTRRIVEYTADSINGFNAVVHREPAVVKAVPAVPPPPPVIPISPVAPAPIAPAVVRTVSAFPAPTFPVPAPAFSSIPSPAFAPFPAPYGPTVVKSFQTPVFTQFAAPFGPAIVKTTPGIPAPVLPAFSPASPALGPAVFPAFTKAASVIAPGSLNHFSY